jgi:hypothetical protein
MFPKRWPLILALFPLLLPAQEREDFQQILQRLNQLEREDHNLAEEVHALRAEIDGARSSSSSTPAAATPAPVQASTSAAGTPANTPPEPVNVSPVPMDERVAVAEQRTAELSQTKVEAAQRMPITLAGMVLFNSFINGRASGGVQNPLTASLSDSVSRGGASLSQSIIGLRLQGPRILGGGQVRGSIDLDLWGGTASSLNHLARMRVATIQVDWKKTTITVGQDKPLIAQRDPDSLAQVAFSPLTDAGNLWLWAPQARIEQRFAIGDNGGLRAQASLYQTSEPSGGVASQYQSILSSTSPALEGRFEFWDQYASRGRIEIAPGFHVSETHVGGVSIPSRLFTIDWMLQPLPKWRLTGTFFHGRNAAGVGGLRQGFNFFDEDHFIAVRTSGGWAQVSFLATKRLTFNSYTGQESDNAADLLAGQISRNFVYAVNSQYRLGQNILLGLEVSQTRTAYTGGGIRLLNHYDLALAYLF